MAKKHMIRLLDRSIVPVGTGAAGAVIANQFPQSKGTMKPIKLPEKNVGRKKVGNRHTKRDKGKFAPIHKSDDPQFNYAAAKLASDLVMKCSSDDEAEMFAYFTMAEILNQDIEKNERTLQRHLNDVARQRIEVTKRALRNTVSKSADTDKYLAVLEQIEKRITDPEKFFWETVAKAGTDITNPYITGRYHFNETDFRRDPRSGRFQAKVNVNADKKAKLSPRQAANLGIDVNDQNYKDLSPQQKAQFQQEYMKVANFINIAHDMGDHDIRLQVEEKNGGHYWRKLNGKPTVKTDWDPGNGEKVRLVEAIPRGGLSLAGASYDLVGGLSQRSMGNIDRASAKFGGFADNWANPTVDANNPNTRLYNRVKTGSNFVGSVAPWDSRVQTAAALGRAIGDHGPQAEKVLGPAARKTAYRYRGVEKTPDADVVRAWDARLGRGERPQLTPGQTKRLNTRISRRLTQEQQKKADAYNKAHPNKQLDADGVVLSASERKAATDNVREVFMQQVVAKPDEGAQQAAVLEVLGEHLKDDRRKERRPDKSLYRLHLDAGTTPPSEGFLIDKDGKIVTQAVGYGDDHYLPFNLKHLKSLRGGEYIRTRSVGGPTSEDIYTGLMAGAKRVTVVSRSGTFVIDFDDDFKGKRRYNDKAHRMVRRYEKLLDSVQSETLERNVQIPIEARRRMHQEVERDLAGLTPKEKSKALKDKITEYKEELGSNRDEFELYVQSQAGDLEGPELNAYVSERMNEFDAHTEQKFRLNGMGYRDALYALAEQFPYYFNTLYIPNRGDEDRVEPEIDRGYVEPGRNRPSQANAGWHGVKQINEGTKFISASHTGYQRGRYGANSDTPITHPVGGPPPPATTTTEGEETPTPAVPNGQLTPEPQLPEERVKEIEEAAQEDFQTAAVRMVKALQEHTTIPSSAVNRVAALGMTDETEMRAWFKDKSNVRAADEFMTAAADLIMSPGYPKEVQDAYTDYRKASGKLGRVNFDPKLALTRSGAPFLFPGQAYLPGADPSLAQTEAERIDRRSKPVSLGGGKYSEMSDKDLDNEIDILDKLNRALPTVEGLEKEEKLKALRDLGIDTTIPGVSYIADKGSIGRQAKDVQKMRALNLNRGDRSIGPSARVEHLPERDPVEVAALKKSAIAMTASLEAAASRLNDDAENEPRMMAASLLRATAADWKERAQQTEIDKGDFNALIDSTKLHLDLAQKVLAEQATDADIENFVDLTEDEGGGYPRELPSAQASIHAQDDDEAGPTLKREAPKKKP